MRLIITETPEPTNLAGTKDSGTCKNSKPTQRHRPSTARNLKGTVNLAATKLVTKVASHQREVLPICVCTTVPFTKTRLCRRLEQLLLLAGSCNPLTGPIHWCRFLQDYFSKN